MHATISQIVLKHEYSHVPCMGLHGNLTIIFTNQDWYNNNNLTDLPTSKRQKMWDSELWAGKSSDKWVKSPEMSQIS